jgi:hypothetical protein
MSTSTPNADDIARQMRDVRTELREDVQEIVENARVLTDWQYYVRSYPWLCLGAAAVVGYLLVPPRVQVIKPDPQLLAELVKQHQVQLKAEVQPQPGPTLMGRLVRMGAGMALQGAMAVASHGLNQFLQQLAAPPAASTGGFDREESRR